MLAIFLIPFALLLLFLALRGRRLDHHPICRRCRFDLRGLTLTRCPECGADLSRPRSIRRGTRRRSPLLACTGALLLLLAASLAITRFKGITWRTIEPFPMLLDDAQRASPSVRRDAYYELYDRLRAGRLSPEQIDRVLELALRLQSAPQAEWSHQLGLFVLEARWMKHATDNQMLRFCRQAVDITCTRSQPIEQGRTFSINADVRADRGASFSTYNLDGRVLEATLDGEPLTLLHDRSRSITPGLGAPVPLDGPAATIDADPGPHILRITWQFSILESDRPSGLSWIQIFEFPILVAEPQLRPLGPRP